MDVGNSYPYFGVVVSGGGNQSAKKGWDVCFDVLPIDKNIIENMTWSKLSMLMPGDEENMESHQMQHETYQEVKSKKQERAKKVSPQIHSQKRFAARDRKH